jgi:hypothetical protein
VKKPFVIRWNIIGFAGGGAFFLSFLLGIFSGNPILTILLRAFLFGVVFALLGGGAAFLLERLIPQLTGGSGGTREREPPGKNIDIMLAGEEPEEERDVEELAMEDADGQSGIADELTEPSMRSRSALFEEEPASEKAEGAAKVPSAFALQNADDEGSEATLLDEKDDDNGEELEETDVIGRPARRGAAASTGDAIEETAGSEKSGEGTDLDVLPDMSHFESSFAPVTSTGMVNDTETYDSFGSDSLKEKGVNEDPATLVKAVRTVIRRDEGKRK